MAIKWQEPHKGKSGNPDVTIRAVARGKQAGRAVFTFSRDIVERHEFTRLRVGFDGSNRIYFMQSEYGYTLCKSRKTENGRLRFMVQDRQLCSLCKVKSGRYNLKYDPREKCHFIDLTEGLR